MISSWLKAGWRGEKKSFSHSLFNRIHQQITNLHSTSKECQKNTMIFNSPLLWETQLQDPFVISARMKTFLSHRCVPNKSFPLTMAEWEYDVSSLWLCVCNVFMWTKQSRKWNQIIPFTSGGNGFDPRRRSSWMKKGFVFLPEKRQALDSHYVINSAAVARAQIHLRNGKFKWWRREKSISSTTVLDEKPSPSPCSENVLKNPAKIINRFGGQKIMTSCFYAAFRSHCERQEEVN